MPYAPIAGCRYIFGSPTSIARLVKGPKLSEELPKSHVRHPVGVDFGLTFNVQLSTPRAFAAIAADGADAADRMSTHWRVGHNGDEASPEVGTTELDFPGDQGCERRKRRARISLATPRMRAPSRDDSSSSQENSSSRHPYRAAAPQSSRQWQADKANWTATAISRTQGSAD